MTPQQIEDRFRAYDLDTDGVERVNAVRRLLGDVAKKLYLVVPAGRDQALMLTKLEEAMFHANAGISRSGNFGVAPTPAVDQAG